MIVFSEFVTEIGCLHHAVLKVQLLFAQYSLTWSIHAMLINRQHALTNTVQNLLSLQNFYIEYFIKKHIFHHYNKSQIFPLRIIVFSSLVVLIPLQIATKLCVTISESILEK